MKSIVTNILSMLPDTTQGEVFDSIVAGDHVRVERIVSGGQVTPEGAWYDQAEHEWVLVLAGAARLEIEEPAARGDPPSWREVALAQGDCLNIPAHCKHRVSWTDPDRPTVWLAVFYR
ncbi:cupin domain-containing protein [Microbulbifer pacificus]|uniref:Cupin domain-containing protein n=1 Tax=Microbulbifer pacificus TaxID=407164 RepID=A0AAU0N4Y6_9GAMM|nr:cupin domain-containing protein [Microbulbifer pacificus]WOX07169.1 cupin domain-containing protein [Microbulbifer pacificus]